jgi:hypothetical protein
VASIKAFSMFFPIFVEMSSPEPEEVPQPNVDVITQTDTQPAFVHIEQFHGTQFIFNCGYRSLHEMLALQERAILLQREQAQQDSQVPTTTSIPTAASSTCPTSSSPVPASHQHQQLSMPTPQETPAPKKTRASTKKVEG